MIKLPKNLKNILDKNQELSVKFFGIISPFADILRENSLYFFPEYTDHGIRHVEKTLKDAENLIAKETFKHLTPEEVGVMMLSVVLHDIGMHTNAEMFKNMIEGKYDNLVNILPNTEEKKWSALWDTFLYDSRYWDDEKKDIIFGNPNYNIIKPNLSDLQSLTEYDKKLIGEFIRIHHCRIAQEVSINGYIGRKTISFGCKGPDAIYIKLAGIIARSHGMDVRDTFEYLNQSYGDEYQTPWGIHAVYLMVLLRLADYLQIDSSRTNETLLKIKSMNSPYSWQEHKTHLCIRNIGFENIDKEKILIRAEPDDAQTFVKIERLAEDIQQELDRSWAILGETYPDYKYKLKYRRITTNIRKVEFTNSLPYVPQQFGFEYNNDLFKLLISPLYGDNPSYGVRELVQNAVDACRLCINDVAPGEKPHVIVKVDSQKSIFTIVDTGKGMNLYEIKNYFLTIGSSYNDNIDWKKARDNEHLYRTGRFGIGVLAAFLLGPEINVVTRKRDGSVGYRFKASLHDKFIQIDKDNTAEYGTTIEIKCDKKSISVLKNDSSWYNWYVDRTPEVKYYYDGKRKTPNQDLEGYRDLNHSSNQYGSVYWKPRKIEDYLRSFNNSTREWTPNLFCNGFIITKESHKSFFSLQGLDEYRYLHIPDLHITDTNNILPLNLQRNQIDDGVKYEFETDLAKEMFVDIMCQLMATDTTSLFEPGIVENINFHSEGFSLQSNLIHNNINEKNVLRLNIGILYKVRKRIGENVLNKWIKLCKDNGFVIRFGGIHGESRTTSTVLKRKINDLVNHITELFYGETFSQIEKVKCGDEGIFQFCEISKKEIKETNSILDKLFEKYMGKDPVVPYRLEDRQKKFPELFHDHKDIIDYYLNCTN